jgi:hypothetical protein
MLGPFPKGQTTATLENRPILICSPLRGATAQIKVWFRSWVKGWYGPLGSSFHRALVSARWAARWRPGSTSLLAVTTLPIPKLAQTGGWKTGRACPLCPGISDVNLFRYCQRIIDLDAEISDRAFDLGMPEQS